MKKFTMTIDLGGTKILSALVDDENNIIMREKVATNIENGAEGIVKDIIGTIENLIKNADVGMQDIKGICLGVPGIINPFEGIIYNAPNLQLKNYNIKSEIQKVIDLPLFLENDVNLGALGIKRVEFNNKVNNMLVIFIGTGIGAALILKGSLYRGSSFFAGEIGHIVLNIQKERSKKNNSTFENFASRTAVVSRIIEAIQDGEPSVLKEYVVKGRKIKSRAIAEAVEAGDKLVKEHLYDSSRVIGNMLGNLQTLLNFDTIVLGGGVIEAAGDFMMPIIKKSFKKSYFDVTGEQTKIVSTKIGDDAPLFGGWEVINEGLSLNIK
ncbi:MAG: ROK family protein [Bacteroidetes bacterium]|nr:ROK family protein [Bacteroidota bacterium]